MGRHAKQPGPGISPLAYAGGAFCLTLGLAAFVSKMVADIVTIGLLIASVACALLAWSTGG